jgi:hypothetical protein
VVRKSPLPSAGSLFLKTHPNSPVLFDMTLSTTHDKQMCGQQGNRHLDRCSGRDQRQGDALEFSQAGTEVWVSDWRTTAR